MLLLNVLLPLRPEFELGQGENTQSIPSEWEVDRCFICERKL